MKQILQYLEGKTDVGESFNQTSSNDSIAFLINSDIAKKCHTSGQKEAYIKLCTDTQEKIIKNLKLSFGGDLKRALMVLKIEMPGEQNTEIKKTLWEQINDEVRLALIDQADALKISNNEIEQIMMHEGAISEAVKQFSDALVRTIKT